MLKHIYLAIKHCLSSIQDINYIDWYLDQYIQIGEDAVRCSPGVYVQFLPIDWITLPNNLQRGILYIRIHLVSNSVYGDEQDMLDTTYINHLEKECRIFQKLQNQSFRLHDVPEMQVLENTDEDFGLCNELVRIRTEPHEELSNLPVTIQTFQCTIFDASALPQYLSILANLKLIV